MTFWQACGIIAITLKKECKGLSENTIDNKSLLCILFKLNRKMAAFTPSAINMFLPPPRPPYALITSGVEEYIKFMGGDVSGLHQVLPGITSALIHTLDVARAAKESGSQQLHNIVMASWQQSEEPPIWCGTIVDTRTECFYAHSDIEYTVRVILAAVLRHAQARGRNTIRIADFATISRNLSQG